VDRVETFIFELISNILDFLMTLLNASETEKIAGSWQANLVIWPVIATLAS
jgi:hypothetical protein